jgi:hypothetical protein
MIKANNMHQKVVVIIGFICFQSIFHYLHAAQERPSSYPFIAGDTFRWIADHIIDETDKPFDPKNVKPQDIIFLKTDYEVRFFETLHPKITVPYILITHNSDLSPIYLMANDHDWLGHDMSRYLDDPKLIVWFAQNIDYVHPKLQPLPIGIGNSYNPHGDVNLFVSATQKIPPFDMRSKKVYLNFTVQNNVQERQAALDYFRQSSYAQIASFKSPAEYLEEMKQYRYVVNPPGNGLDCHRTWEALMLGCIPIMKHSLLNPMFEDLPVVFVDNWSDVTEDFLEEKSIDLLQKRYKFEKAYADYWINVIKNYQVK